MSAQQHTQGPWRVSRHLRINNEWWLSIGPVAELKYLAAQEDEQLANAYLIASAPEMYEALKAVIGCKGFTRGCRIPEEVFASATSAIAKAEGRS